MQKEAPRNNHPKKFTKSKDNSTQSYANQLTMKEKANQINISKEFFKNSDLSEGGRPGKLPSKGLEHSGAPCLWLEELFSPHNGANGSYKATTIGRLWGPLDSPMGQRTDIKPDHLSSIPKTHMVEKENLFMQGIL